MKSYTRLFNFFYFLR